MSPLAIVLSSLTGTSLLVTLALAIAWRRFGREPHAKLWALGFAASTAGYGAQLVGTVLPATGPATILIATDSLGLCVTLLALGFRRRAGLATPAAAAIAGALALATIATVLGLTLPDPRLPRVTADLIAFVALTLSAIAVRDDAAGAHAPGVATMWILFGVAAYCGVLAGLAAAISADGPVTPELYRALVLVGVPGGMTAIGLGTLLLLGGDLAERLERLAELDPLTGLLNRRGVERAGSRLVAQAARSGRPLAVVVADLDRFKAINDTLGHAAGDEALIEAARRLRSAVRMEDTVGRLGGDEFVIVCEKVAVGREDVLCARIREQLAAPFVLTSGQPVELSATLGMVRAAQNETASALIARADEAMYDVRRTDRAGIPA